MGRLHRKNRTNYGEHITNPFLFAVQTGFFAGLIWGMTRWIFHQMNFTTELPGFLLEPFLRRSFLMTVWGGWTGLAGFILFSIIAALLYQVVLGRLRGPWPGVGYGLLWWFIIFICIGPQLSMTKQVTVAGWNTFYTELCVFILWGVFIGYTIAFEFTDEASREPAGAK